MGQLERHEHERLRCDESNIEGGVLWVGQGGKGKRVVERRTRFQCQLSMHRFWHFLGPSAPVAVAADVEEYQVAQHTTCR